MTTTEVVVDSASLGRRPRFSRDSSPTESTSSGSEIPVPPRPRESLVLAVPFFFI